MSTKKTVLALGADIKNRFLFAKQNRFFFGPDISDLSDAKNYEFFKKEIYKVIKVFNPGVIAYDLHPNYFSTQLAKAHSPQPRAHSPVQHHHAHVASVMYEHGLERPAIGVSFDGTGLGTDGNIWGGEFLLVDRKGFKRLAHLKYNKMSGGEKTVHEPWRMAVSILGRKAFPFIKSVRKETKELILSMMSKNINSPLTSSAGRLFDAAAALLGICERASYEAEGPIKLERICRADIEKSYEFSMSKNKEQEIIDTEPIFSDMLKDLRKNRSKSVIATKFHNSMADVIVKTAKRLSGNTGVKNIALSGGVFQNNFLKVKAIKKLTSLGFKVFTNEKVPVNDFNISLGQYYVSCGSGKS